MTIICVVRQVNQLIHLQTQIKVLIVRFKVTITIYVITLPCVLKEENIIY